jgi:hypothetical protein
VGDLAQAPLDFMVGTALPLAGLAMLHLMAEIRTAADARWLQMVNYVVAGVLYRRGEDRKVVSPQWQ